MMNGLITDIQRFSLQDGPGIRTTVFLKGCPLRCAWCHNPESLVPAQQLRFIRASCTGCGACVGACPRQAHKIAAGGGHEVDFARCDGCGSCVSVCPQGALSMAGRWVTTDAVLEEVLRDRQYYEASGGGLTLSGGEPLLQTAFARALLEEAQKEGLHTCVESCLFVPGEVVREIAPFVDLFLADWKITDREAHLRWTGQDNQRILENLRLLASLGAQILLRCPIIPGINDKAGHYDGIAELLEKLPGIQGVELMAYHAMGAGKYAQLGLEYTLPALRHMEAESKKAILDAVQSRTRKAVRWGS